MSQNSRGYKGVTLKISLSSLFLSPNSLLRNNQCFAFLYYLHEAFCVHVRAQSLSCVQLSVTPWTTAQLYPLSMAFPR